MDATTNSKTAKAATNQGALPLGKLTLIGVFGPDTDLEALVRTERGQIKRVKKGSRLRRSIVSAIAPDRILLSHGPTTETLTFPG